MNERMMKPGLIFVRPAVLLACVLVFGCTGPTQDTDTAVEPDVSELVSGDQVEPDAMMPDASDVLTDDLDVAPEDLPPEAPPCVPEDEICDGLDNDCDGEVDNLDMVSGECDDGDPCTVDSCAGTEGCVSELLDGGACDDGDPCTEDDLCDGAGICAGSAVDCDDDNVCTIDSCGADGDCDHALVWETECDDASICTENDTCIAGVCTGDAIDCDDGDLCTDDVCDPVDGCIHPDNHVPCNDMDPCTVSDNCTDGVCVGFEVPCGCTVDGDCDEIAALDLCAGALQCDLIALPPKCAVTPYTWTLCVKPQGLGAECLESFCDPGTGECSFVPANDGAACDDGDLCTMATICVAGVCEDGLPTNCHDENVCTTDTCDPMSGCVYAPNDNPCTDVNLCTVGDHCEDEVCAATGALPCDDGNLCTDDSCAPAVGCVHDFNTLPCDDGDACTVDEMCSGGSCFTLAPLVNCDDGNVCTTESCDPASGCVFANNLESCTDADACTTGDHCEEGSCVTTGIPDCDDGNVCTDDSCDPATGCVNANNVLECTDADACTLGDVCVEGACQSGMAKVCDDENVCTDDVCVEGECVFTANAAECTDDDACTLGDHCADSQCMTTGVEVCDDENPCTDDSCDPAEGCVFTPNQELCDDENACTGIDICAEGQCVPGDAVDCTDEDPCSADTCEEATGCVHTNVPIDCMVSDWGDWASCETDDGTCQGTRLHSRAITLEPACGGVECPMLEESEACDMPGETSCDDLDVCTLLDVCDDQGACAGTPSVEILEPDGCDDDDPCTLDSCTSGESAICNHTPSATVPVAEGGCDDGNPGTADSCDPESGCVNVIIPEWTELATDFLANTYKFKLALLDDEPYLVTVAAWAGQEALGEVSVRRWDGEAWVSASDGLEMPLSYVISAKVNDNKLYVSGFSGAIRVYSDSTWEALPNHAPGTTGGSVIDFDDNGDLYVAYIHNEDGSSGYNWRLSVKKLDTDTNTWEPVGYSGPEGLGVWSYGGQGFFDLAVTGGTPYVFFTQQPSEVGIGASDPEWADSVHNIIMRFSDDTWSVVGDPGDLPTNAQTSSNNHVSIQGETIVATLQHSPAYCHTAATGWQICSTVSSYSGTATVPFESKLHSMFNNSGLTLHSFDGTTWNEISVPLVDDGLGGSQLAIETNGTVYVVTGLGWPWTLSLFSFQL
ncbi:MAG: hypothetical protein ABIK09_02970 [Pseudomonadota bacterium]